MKINRVFVTGVGIVSAFGNSWSECRERFLAQENAVCIMEDYKSISDLRTYLAAPIKNYQHPSEWGRKEMRSMGLVSKYSVHAAKLALEDAKCFKNGVLDPYFQSGVMGVAGGSSTGSTDAIVSMAKLFLNGQSDCNANTYVKMMPHTIVANIAIFFGLKGRILPTSSACTSGSHAIGYAYESIKYGKIPMMLAGGGEELCVSETFVFDSLYATSTQNQTPKITPRPFDVGRDGLVLGEGACFLVLESEESVLKRGIKPIAEIVGFGSTCDGTHITRPQSQTMANAMKLALEDAMLQPKDVAYISAHATATEHGDIQESLATHGLFGEDVAISSLKSYLGHTLGACGAMESLFSIMMMKESRFYPTINLQEVDPRCAKLNYLQNITSLDCEYVMNNNFAFGGINTSLIFKKI